MGYIYGEQKLLYLSACDCLVLPSHTEGAPVVLMEAMAMDLPVIATNVGGIPLMLKNKKNGLIIEPHSSESILNAIQYVFKNPLKEVRKYAYLYRWERIIRKTIMDYEFK